MRIIAGEFRSRRLIPPAGRQTRPILDRVKQSLFDRLAAMDAIDDAVVLDLFAGVGSMGLEALSRGARRVVFVEKDRDARDRLQRNIDALGAGDRAVIGGRDVFHHDWLALTAPDPIDLLLLDPPYAMIEDPRGVARVRWALASAGPDIRRAAVVRTPADHPIHEIDNLQIFRHDTTASMAITVFVPQIGGDHPHELRNPA